MLLEAGFAQDGIIAVT